MKRSTPILSFFAGAGVILITVFDVFQSVVVPRPTGRRFRGSSFISQYSWITWTRVAYRIGDDDAREDFLGAFAPLLLISLLVFWVLSLIAGYGLIFFALRGEIRPMPGFAESFYFAGTSLATIGFGDFAPMAAPARFLSIAAGASGLGAFAIITAFLFPIVGAYQQREAFVVSFTNRAGSPPSGIDMIETHFRLGIIDSLVSTMRSSELWMAQVLETHLAYPILTYFRSTHDEISWVAVLGTILDASTLVITTLDTDHTGEAKIVNRLGRHLVNDFSKRFGLPQGDQIGIDRHEFDLAFDRLRDAGVPLRDRDRAWKEFGEIRATYANQLNRMAKYWAIPPAQWFGDRSLIPHHGLLEVASARER